MTPEQRLMRSLPALRALVDSLATRSPSEARELLHLDFLVRKYPAAARMSLQRRQRTHPELPAPPGWSSVSDTGGLPLWRWAGGPVCVATTDPDQLRFLEVALARFDEMTAEELHAYLHGAPDPARRRVRRGDA
ncbi:hypothetical protein [Actinoallomurus soli]|uniref:hypothetical protein n=1 Tax=Actinoallomurus soli TaxID=2952535 RepID=UPI002091EBA2|nr:hypothetical protein [Actinoallomurus soli]MCO5967513.1 hypothetical protein [Actinoallomurus soli]